MKVKVWVYKGRIQLYKWQFRFFKENLTGIIVVKGNKKFRLPYLLSRTKLEKDDPTTIYLKPDMIYTFYDRGKSL